MLVAEDGNQIVGIAPLFLESFQRKKVLRFKRLYALGEGLSDYSGLLAKDNRDAVCARFLEYLGRNNAWHELRWQNIPDITGDFDRLCVAGRKLRFNVRSQERKPTHCFYVETGGDFQAYLKTTSRDVKKDVPRRLNMIEDSGGFELKFTGEIGLSELLQAMAGIHAKRQSELGRESFLEHASERAFVEEIARQYHQKGWLDYVAMYIKAELAAYMFGFHYGGVRYSWNVSFDPKYNELSLGKVLAYLWIEDAFNRQEITEFNFMRGDSEFKRKFTDKCRYNHHFIVRHPRSLYVRGVEVAERVLKSIESPRKPK